MILSPGGVVIVEYSERSGGFGKKRGERNRDIRCSALMLAGWATNSESKYGGREHTELPLPFWQNVIFILKNIGLKLRTIKLVIFLNISTNITLFSSESFL